MVDSRGGYQQSRVSLFRGALTTLSQMFACVPARNQCARCNKIALSSSAIGELVRRSLWDGARTAWTSGDVWRLILQQTPTTLTFGSRGDEL